MSLNYNPDASAGPNGTWDTTFLSDRDVSAQVPINFVPHPGVYMTTACFGNDVFESNAARNCLSNLLSSQIRRYVIDLYWDTVNERFALCPVEIPNQSSSTAQSVNAEGPASVANIVTAARLLPRQATSTAALNNNSAIATSTTVAATATYSVISSDSDTQVYQLGPYQCSNTLTLASITSIFSDYLDKTANTLDAKIVIWVLNLHLATTWEQPTVTRTELDPVQLPNSTTAISNYLNDIQEVLYGPGALLGDRQNLNTSWYRTGSADEIPLASYYTTYTLPNGDTATDDGWPDENYIQNVRGKRLLVGFGELAAGMADYNTSMDGESVYPPGYITANQIIPFEPNGELARGCHYNPDIFAIAEVNNSWASATINAIDPPGLGDTADNLTACGFSQLLNVTIGGITADQAAGPYQDYGNNAVFSWAYNQPQNDSSDPSNSDGKFRCALVISDDAYRGHWRVQSCNDRYRVACREADSPYKWRISTYRVPYDSGDAACTGNATFETPRTGLENTYLYNKILEDADNDASLLEGVWINFNALSVENCWVTTGINGTCPYYQDSSATYSRQILIPTIAALIVLMLTILTILVKCSANARNSRIRRRGEAGWDYEGVPS